VVPEFGYVINHATSGSCCSLGKSVVVTVSTVPPFSRPIDLPRGLEMADRSSNKATVPAKNKMIPINREGLLEPCSLLSLGDNGDMIAEKNLTLTTQRRVNLCCCLLCSLLVDLWILRSGGVVCRVKEEGDE
jgi:hypothetical protein